MRSKILELLREQKGSCISGEEIASRLGVSRTAVWKHIRELKAAGYNIESKARSGYSLTGTPDRLLPELITHNLPTKLLGQSVLSFEEVRSTNDEAKKAAAAGADEGTVVVSEMQSTGNRYHHVAGLNLVNIIFVNVLHAVLGKLLGVGGI